MAELLQRNHHWVVAKLQRPPAAHFAFTDASSAGAQSLIDSVRACVKQMKADKQLNQNKDTAVYGLTGMIPDKQFLRKFICIHQAAMLDTLE